MGARTDADKELAFREAYLRTGNARKSAREVGLNEKTGHVLSQRAQADPEFRQARAELRARMLPDAMARLADTLDNLHDDIGKLDSPSAEDLAKLAVEYDLKSLNWQNPKAALAKILLDAVKVLQGGADDTDKPRAPVTINIVRAGADRVEPEDSDAAGS